MHQNTTSSAPAFVGEASRFLTTSWQLIRLHDNVLFCLSFALLVLSSADSGPLGAILKVCWLASFVSLTFTNIGAAFAAYISSLAIYSPLHFEGLGSPLQRPDNYALVILFVGILPMVFNKKEARLRFNAYILAFVTFSILHGVIFSPVSFAALAALSRDILIPLLACEFLAIIELRERELDALQNGIAVLGSYMGLVSILERISASKWILPPGSGIHR